MIIGTAIIIELHSLPSATEMFIRYILLMMIPIIPQINSQNINSQLLNQDQLSFNINIASKSSGKANPVPVILNYNAIGCCTLSIGRNISLLQWPKPMIYKCWSLFCMRTFSSSLIAALAPPWLSSCTDVFQTVSNFKIDFSANVTPFWILLIWSPQSFTISLLPYSILKLSAMILCWWCITYI